MGELEDLCEPEYSKRTNPNPVPPHPCMFGKYEGQQGRTVKVEQALAKKTEMKLKGYCVSCRQTLLAQVR